MARSELLILIRHAGTDGGEADAALLGRFVARRDEAAFAELVRRYARLVWGQCRNLLSNEADADDAFQATFLALAKSARSVRDTDRLGPWLHAVAHRVCLNARRAATRRAERERTSAIPEGTRPVADSAWDAAAAAVHEEVNRLPETLRVAFVLCHLEGKAPTDAAKQLGVPWGTFSARLCRARQRLLERLAARGIVATVALAAVTTPSASAAAVERAVTLGSAGVTAPASIHSLLTGVTPMGILRTKVAVLVAMLAGAVLLLPGGGRGVPTASAQPPKPMAEVKGAKLDNHGDPLPDKAVLRLGTEKFRASQLSGIGFKPTGELVALTMRMELIEWPADGGTPKRKALRPEATGGRFWALSPDGRYAAENNDTGTAAVVWDITGEKPVEYTSKELQYPRGFRFSPDGRYLTCTRPDVSARPLVVKLHVCELKTKKWSEYQLPNEPGESFAFSRNGRYVSLVGGTEALVLDLKEGAELVRVKAVRTNVRGTAVSDDGKTLAVLPLTFPNRDPATVLLYDTANGGDAELVRPAVDAEWVRFAPDGKTLRFGVKGAIREWDATAGKWLPDLPATAGTMTLESPDGKRYATRTRAAVLLWDAKTHKPIHPEAVAGGHTDSIGTIAVGPDGKRAVTTSYMDHEWCLWDLTTGKLIHRAKGGWGLGQRVAFLPDASGFVTVAEDAFTPVLHDGKTGKEVYRFTVPEDVVKKVHLEEPEVSADGKTFTALAAPTVSDRRPEYVRWDVATGKETARAKANPTDQRDLLIGAATSPDGRWNYRYGNLTLVGDDKKVEVIPAGEASIGGCPPFFSADNRYLLALRLDPKTPRDRTKGSTVVFDLTAKKVVQDLPSGAALRAAFHPDGQHIATVTADTVALWDLKTGKAVWQAASPPIGLISSHAIAFTPDGKRLITAHDTTALVWDIAAK